MLKLSVDKSEKDKLQEDPDIRALTLCEFYLEELGQVFIVSVAGGGERGWGNALLLARG